MADFLSMIVGKSSRTLFTKQEEGKEKTILLVDITTLRTSNYEAEVTSNPVESGPDVSDHVRLKPVTLQIDGVVSETPLTLTSAIQGVIAGEGARLGAAEQRGFGSTLGGVAGSLGSGAIFKLFQTAEDPPATFARKVLEEMIVNRTLFTVVTKRRKFDDMVFTSLSFPEDSGSQGVLRFQARLQQLQIVKSETVLIEKIRSDAAHSAAAKSQLGSQSAKAATEEKSKKSSLLHKLLIGGG